MTENAEPPDDDATASTDDGTDAGTTEQPLPDRVVDEAERLTRLAREAVNDDEADAYRSDRESLLADHGYVGRVREDDDGDVLVLYPDEWVEDGLVQTDRIEDVERGVEIPLEGTADTGEWDEVAAHNRRVADEVARRYDDVHGANAEAFAEFMSNHYAKPVESATPTEKEAFLTDYFPRNAWPSEEQRAVVEESLSIVTEVATDLSEAPE